MMDPLTQTLVQRQMPMDMGRGTSGLPPTQAQGLWSRPQDQQGTGQAPQPNNPSTGRLPPGLVNNPGLDGRMPGPWASNTQPAQGSAPFGVQTQPPAVAPNAHPALPPAWQRFSNSQQIQDAYRQNWSPNPLLLRAMLGR